ncbi:glycosyl transferase [Methylophilaceae bacterium 11]|uniref:glycosyltransferase n=1 Tax=Methylotenera sp. N17 TaxID=1502761 RepID=UPI0004455116|nr:glycosyltransferase [Methylotenera sp. N17]EUJ09964.1 glycosyl transferase [Methylophilaceae bacterium 11]
MSASSDDASQRIAIVLSTYNGEAYIAAQLDSLIAQTYQNWRCYIRDDGSKDESITIIKRYVAQDPRFIFLEDQLGNLGVVQAYFHLFNKVDEPYIAACDQDDVWFPEKLERSLRLLQSIETVKKIPALVHTDSAFVDSQLNSIRDQFIGRRGLKTGLNGIIIANSVQGGSTLFNRALNNESRKISAKLPYDYHLGMIAELTGARGFISDNLLYYRQHNSSSIARNDAKLQDSESSDISPTLQVSLSNYRHVKQDFSALDWTSIAKKQVAEYLYLFEGSSKLKKLYILFKNRYAFYRRKDLLSLIVLILKHKNLLGFVGNN